MRCNDMGFIPSKNPLSNDIKLFGDHTLDYTTGVWVNLSLQTKLNDLLLLNKEKELILSKVGSELGFKDEFAQLSEKLVLEKEINNIEAISNIFKEFYQAIELTKFI